MGYSWLREFHAFITSMSFPIAKLKTKYSYLKKTRRSTALRSTILNGSLRQPVSIFPLVDHFLQRPVIAQILFFQFYACEWAVASGLNPCRDGFLIVRIALGVVTACPMISKLSGSKYSSGISVTNLSLRFVCFGGGRKLAGLSSELTR